MTEVEKLRADNRKLSKANVELQAANFQLEGVIQRYLEKAMDDGDEIFDQCEEHKNVTVEIWTNSKTGKQSFAWRRENV